MPGPVELDSIQSQRRCSPLTRIFFAIIILNLVTGLSIGQTIESIDILGNRRLTDQDILKNIGSEVGQLFDENQAKRDVESIIQTGQFVPQSTRFKTAAGKNGGIALLFEVLEFPLIGEFKIDGLRYITEDEIRNELRKQGAEIRVNAPYDLQRMRKVHEVVQEFLKERGYEQAAVNLTEEDVDYKTVKVALVIKELPIDEDPY